MWDHRQGKRMDGGQQGGQMISQDGGAGYEDILYLSRPVSRHHAPMPAEARAAQFAPFAALTGYEGEIRRTALRHQDDVAREIEHVAWEDEG